jgi:filamentous hemagglutinin family protein
LASLFSGNRVLAQSNIVADDTLGTEGSVVIQNQNFNGVPTEVMAGGAERGQNLFHSFQEFNVEANRNALFLSPNADIRNILARVTGGNPSQILGTLGTFQLVNGAVAPSEANLFLINPRGIVFGSNARLAVGGSFVASTADSLVFENDFDFGATNPETPPLLTINVPVGLQYGETAERIRVQGGGLQDFFIGRGLRGQPERTLALVGGEIDVEGGTLFAPNGRVELGSVAGNSLVSLLPTDAGYTLDYEGVRGFQDIRLSRAAFVGSSGGDSSSIQTQGRNIILTEGSRIIVFTQGQEAGGNLNINATESVKLIGGGGLFTTTQGGGDGGNLTLKAGQLLVQDGAQVSASTSTGSEGNSGSLAVEVEELVRVIGTALNGQSASSISAEAFGTGNGGDVRLKARQLLVRDGATVSASTFGEGDGGSLTVEVEELVQVIGTTPNGQFVSGIGAETRGTGNGGDVKLTARQLLVQDGAIVSASTRGEGNSGSLSIEVSDLVQLIGTAPNNLFPSGVFATTTSMGDGGNLTLKARQLLVQDGAQVSAGTFQEGKGGSLSVEVSELVELVGTVPNALSPSGISVETSGKGEGGSISLTARQLLVRDGASISASTFGGGKGGSLSVEVSDWVRLIGSGVFATTQGSGDGGNLTLTARQLLVQDGAGISASTGSEGKGGMLILDVSESILLDRGVLGVVSVASGNAGDLILTTDQLTVQNNSFISVSSPDSLAGNLTITANTLSLNNGEVSAETGVTGAEEGANITLQDLDLLLLENESLISATALEDANGGNVTINADFIVAKSPEGPEGSDIIANAFEGNGGRVSVTSNGLFGIEFRPQRTPLNDITVSSQFGLAGDFIDNTPGIDPSQGLATLPSNLVDPESLIDRSCTPGSAALQSSFIITGRGGIPTSPTDPLSSNDVVSEWVTLDTEEETTAVTETPTHPTSSTPEQIVEAQGWIVNERGQVVLVANAPTVSPHTPRQTSPSCEDIRANAHE